MNVDYSSFIYSIILQLSDQNLEIVTFAQEALVEIGKKSPTKMCQALIKELTGYSSTTASNINRVEIIKTLHKIIISCYNPSLISTVVGPVVSLLTFSPPLGPDITSQSIAFLNTLCKLNCVSTCHEFRTIQSNTFAFIEFLIGRVKLGELTFFIEDENVGKRPTVVFTNMINNLSKTADDKVRAHICQLLIDLSDLLIDTKTDFKILTTLLLTAVDIIMNSWMKTTPLSATSHFLNAVSAVIFVIDIPTIIPKIDRIIIFFNESLTTLLTSSTSLAVASTSGAAASKRAAASGVASVISLIDKIVNLSKVYIYSKEYTKPKIQAANAAKNLFDFVENEYANIQVDGATMRAINGAVGALTTLMIHYPKAPLEIVLKKIPSAASFYTLNYFCNNFGNDREVVQEIAYALATAKFNTIQSSEAKSLYANCFFTLIKKLEFDVHLNFTETSNTAIKTSFGEILKNIISFISIEDTNKDPFVRDTIIQFTFVCNNTVQRQMANTTNSNTNANTNANAYISVYSNSNSNANDQQNQQRYDSFKHTFPKIFAYLMLPNMFFASPTLITVSSFNTDYIRETINSESGTKYLNEARIDKPALISHLLMFEFSELFTVSTKKEIYSIVSAIAGIEENENSSSEGNEGENDYFGEKLVQMILKKFAGDKIFHEMLLKYAQNQISNYVYNSSSAPASSSSSNSGANGGTVFSLANRGALLAGSISLIGCLLQSEHNLSQLETLQSSLLEKLNTGRDENLGNIAIAKFIGLVSAQKPDFSVNFLRAQMDMIIMNQDNRLKFWKKKERPLICPISCVLATGEILKYAPQGYNNFNTIFANFNVKFVERKDIPDWAKMRTIENAFVRNKIDPSKFTLTDAKRIATRCSLCIQDSKKPDEVPSFIAAINALTAAIENNTTFVERPEFVLQNCLKFIEKDFKQSDLYECVKVVSKIVSKIITVYFTSKGGKSTSFSPSSIITTFHESIFNGNTNTENTNKKNNNNSGLIISNINNNSGNVNGWKECVDSLLLVVNSFDSVTIKESQNVIKFLQMSEIYFVIGLNKNYENSFEISRKLLSFLLSDSPDGNASIDISTPLKMAQLLIDFCEGGKIPPTQNFIQHLFSVLTPLSHSSLGLSANSLLRSFAMTTQASTTLINNFIREYIICANESGEAIINLFKADKESVIEILLSNNELPQTTSQTTSPATTSSSVATATAQNINKNEPFVLNPNVSTSIQTLFSENEIRHDFLITLLKKITKKNIEVALNLLNVIKYSLPFNTVDGAILVVKLSILNMKSKNVTVSNLVCSVFGAMIGENSNFSNENSTDRKRMSSPSDAHVALRHVFKCLAEMHKENLRNLFEICRKQEIADIVAQTVVAVVLGQILNVASSCSTSSQSFSTANSLLIKEIVEFLIDISQIKELMSKESKKTISSSKENENENIDSENIDNGQNEEQQNEEQKQEKEIKNEEDIENCDCLLGYDFVIAQRVIALSELRQQQMSSGSGNENTFSFGRQIVSFLINNVEIAPTQTLAALAKVTANLTEEEVSSMFIEILNVVQMSLNFFKKENTKSSSIDISVVNQSLLSSSLRILTTICSAPSLLKDSRATERFWQLYPLVMCVTLSEPSSSNGGYTSYEEEVNEKTIEALNSRIGISSTMKYGKNFVTKNAGDFLIANSDAVKQAVADNPERFAKNLTLAKIEEHPSSKIREAYAYFVTFLLKSFMNFANDNEYAEIYKVLSSITEQLMGDINVQVRLATAKGFGSLNN